LNQPYRVFLCYATRGRVLPGPGGSGGEDFYTAFYYSLNDELAKRFGDERSPRIYYGPVDIDQRQDWQVQVTEALRSTIALITFIGAPGAADRNINCDFEYKQFLACVRDENCRSRKPQSYVLALRLRTVFLSPNTATKWVAKKIWKLSDQYFDDQGEFEYDQYDTDATQILQYQYVMGSR
jgi:hypothetical protein